MGAGERISRRAVVRAGETAAEMLKIQQTFMEETSKVTERLKDAYDRNKEQIEDIDSDLGSLKSDMAGLENSLDDLKEGLEDAQKELESTVSQCEDNCEEYVDNELSKRDAQFDNLERQLARFIEMGFISRMKWLMTGEF